MKELSKEELRKVQLLELKILKEIKRICDKHDIRYFLTGGTLIGAVRHKGFIPWDDDIDIGMLRTDYDRFIEIAPKELKQEFSLICIQHNENIATYFSKVVLNGTIYRGIQQPENNKKFGFLVDVLPYDNIYDNKFMAALYFWRISFYEVLYSMKCGYKNGTTRAKKIVARLIKVCFYFIPKKCLKQWILNYPYKLNEKKTKRISYLTGRYGFIGETKTGSLFNEFTEIQFEDDVFSCVKNYDAFLRECYGDYMQLPPESKRVTHQIAELDFGGY